MPSVFANEQAEFFPFRFSGQLTVACLAGGTPTDQNVAEGWLKTKLKASDDLIREMVGEVMVDRGVSAEEAARIVDTMKHLNGFRRDDAGLYIEGRQLKAALKEAASCAMAADKLQTRGWGKTNKGLLSYLAEHVFIEQTKLHLFDQDGAQITEPSGINQRFVHTFRGSGIQYEEYVNNAVIDFTVIADHDFTDREWAAIWTSGEQQGIGASRSQGYGRYEVTRWDATHRTGNK
jgi:hypothetical protein